MLGNFDSENGTFRERSKGQASPFPEVNAEALAMVMDAIVKKVHGKSLADIEDAKLLNLLDGSQFGKLYGYALHSLKSRIEPRNVEGKWVMYKRGSDPTALVNSLKDMNTGWCTAGEAVAQDQLRDGDFYVFYSLDDQGVAKIPRIAIRMEGPRIGEIRGTAHKQNLDPEIAASDVLQRKLSEFGEEGKNYLQRESDMRYLTAIDERQAKGLKLANEELRFLYELDRKIQGFGHQADPRIRQIISKRHLKEDLAGVLGLQPHQIASSPSELKNADIQFYYGDLDLASLKVIDFTWPEVVSGKVHLGSIYHLENMKFPSRVGGDFSINNLETAQNVTLPRYVGGNLSLGKLKSLEGVQLPEEFVYADLSGVKSLAGFVMPQHFKNISFGFRAGEGLQFPAYCPGGLSFSWMNSAQGMVLPEVMDGDLNLSTIRNVEGLILPRVLKGTLKLPYGMAPPAK